MKYKLKITPKAEGEGIIKVKGLETPNYSPPPISNIYVTVQPRAPYTSVLNDNSWEQIQTAIRAEQAPNLWSIGDAKSDTIKGTVGILDIDSTYDFTLADMNHNKNVLSNGDPNGLFLVTALNESGAMTVFRDSWNTYTEIPKGSEGFCINPLY